MIVNSLHSNMLVSPARTITGKVELYTGSTLTSTFLGTDKLASFTVNRAGDKKIFGFGIGQELEVKLLDKARSTVINKGDILKVYYGVNDDYVTTTPVFYVSDVTRDENTNALTVKASDILAKTRLHTVAELGLNPPYNTLGLAAAIARFFGMTLVALNVLDDSLAVRHEEGANFGDDELLRNVLDDIAEATQTIYYADSENSLVFKRLDKEGDAVTTITKSDYFTLKSKDTVTLTSICHATELGDNLTATTGEEGYTQYIRDNALWNLRTDTAELLDKAIAAVGGLAVDPFNCEWRGNYLLELGDKIDIQAKEGIVSSYFINDKLTFDGGLSASSSWELPTDKEETASNSTSLGDKINQTFAKVDKLEQNITLYVGEALDEFVEKVAQLEMDSESITAKVSHLEASTEVLDERLATVAQEAALKVDAEGVEILIEQSLTGGVDKVITSSKKYTFDDNGLNVSSSGSNISTSITENGMTISRGNDEVLVADNQGVKAEDLHATTYLIIGETARLEDRNGRTACFWIGE